jgi:hypothetical protein
MKFIIFGVAFLASFCVCLDAAKILAVYTTFSKSHLLVGQNLLKNLAIRGHEVSHINRMRERQTMTKSMSQGDRCQSISTEQTAEKLS